MAQFRLPISLILLAGVAAASVQPKVTKSMKGHQDGTHDYVAGYLIIPVDQHVDRSFNAGYSLYVAAWPLQAFYPGHEFETGLPGTWMFAQYDGAPPKKMYSDVEGGLGWWTATRFPQLAPKFIMGGVGPNFEAIANGPYAGVGTWEKPRGLYSVIQLSSRLLFPPDGLNLSKTVHGELFGYGYLNLPLLQAKPASLGNPYPSGGNCWTLFLNSANFKGPVAFFAPYFWAHFGEKQPDLIGQLLDTRPNDPHMQIQMETHYIPCKVATDGNGNTYARVAPTRFPLNSSGNSILVANSTCYNKSALWDSVQSWFNGGAAPSGKVNDSGAFHRDFHQQGYATWEIYVQDHDGHEEKVPLDFSAFATPESLSPNTYGYKWNAGTKPGAQHLTTIPEYFKLGTQANGKPVWLPVAEQGVPLSTGLQSIVWKTPPEPPQDPITMPIQSDPTWMYPGPKAGPFHAKLDDGSTVTYYWYRFEDQPALQHVGLTQQDRDALQLKVEKIQKHWKIDGTYLADPKLGKLARIDPTLIVQPPKGLEVGYVPVVTRQELAKK